MKKHKKNTFDKNKKAAAGAALGVAAAAAGIAAVAGGKDVESEEVANDENAADSQTERGLEEAAASAAGQMADDVANVEQAPLDSDTSEMSAVSNDIIVDDDVIIVENSTEPISDDVDVMVVESTDGPAFVEPAAPEPAVVEHVAVEPAAPEPVTVEPVTVEPVVQNEPVVEDVQVVNDNQPDNDVAVLENDPMYHPGTVGDGDYYDPDVNAVDYMAEGEGIPDELMDNDGVAGWADGIVEGIKDLGESIANVFSGDAKDDFMNGDSNGIDEDGSPDYINDANVDAFQ